MYWQSLKTLWGGFAYNDKDAQDKYEASETGIRGNRLFKHGWNWKEGSFKRAVRQQILPGMYSYVWRRHGWKCTRLRHLIEKYDDEIALSQDACGAHLIEDAQSQELEEAGAAHFANCLAPLRRSRRLKS